MDFSRRVYVQVKLFIEKGELFIEKVDISLYHVSISCPYIIKNAT